MTDHERRDSLAEQAAAWVPPWARDTSPGEPDPLDPAERDGSAEFAESAERGRAERRPAERDEPAEFAEAAKHGAAEPGPAEPGPAERDASAGRGGAAESAEPARAAEAPAVVPEPGGEPAAVDEPADAEPSGRAAEAPAVVPEPGGEPAAVDEPAAADVPRVEESARDAGAAGGDGPEPGPDPATAGEPAAPAAGAAASPLALADDAELRGAIEAILLVVDEPVTEPSLAQVLEQPTERVAAILDRIAADYAAAGHGFELRRAAGGWRLYTRPEYARYVERFVLDGQSVRLTQAALETLAVIAYKEPVTRSRISAIRGVNCDGVVRTLVSRGLVEECGAEPETGAYLYRTTTLFLEKLGLDSVDELPPLAPFLPEDVEEIADAQR